MLFIAAKNEPAIIMLLFEKDIKTIKEGRTIFVDERVTKGATFKEVVFGYAQDENAAKALIEQSGYDLVTMKQKAHEVQCQGCNGFMTAEQLLDGKCIVCWRQKVKELTLGNPPV